MSVLYRNARYVLKAKNSLKSWLTWQSVTIQQKRTQTRSHDKSAQRGDIHAQWKGTCIQTRVQIWFIRRYLDIYAVEHCQWQIQNVSDGSANPKCGGDNLLCGQIFLENYLKMKEIRRQEGTTLEPHFDLQMIVVKHYQFATLPEMNKLPTTQQGTCCVWTRGFSI